MEPTSDEIAGVVDLFGALTRREVHAAIEDLAARHGTEFDPDAVDRAIERALDDYVLLEVERDGEALLATGPTAFPALPEDGEDLPHMLDVSRRDVDRAALAEAAEERLRAEAVAAIDGGDEERIVELLDLCYEIDAWASVDLSDTRERLADATSDE